MLKFKKVTTQLLGGVNAGSAYDLEILPNIRPGKEPRTIISFDNPRQRDAFTRDLIGLLVKHEAWDSEVEVRDDKD